MTVRESGEMYLEAILVLAKKSGYVRSIDVSEYLGYSKPSVSRAMGILREGGYILMEKDGAITLTDSGKKLAETLSIPFYDKELLELAAERSGISRDVIESYDEMPTRYV